MLEREPAQHAAPGRDPGSTARSARPRRGTPLRAGDGWPRSPREHPVARLRTSGRSSAAGTWPRMTRLPAGRGCARPAPRVRRGHRRRASSARPQIASAWSTAKPPANTDSRSRSRCSGSRNRSLLQPIAACSVRWRSGASRDPEPGRSSLRPSRSAMSRAGRSAIREAAISMPSGSPSRRRQISATASTSSATSLYPGRTRAARSTKRRIASFASASSTAAPAPGRGNGGTGNSCSPATRNGARLVATIVESRRRLQEAGQQWSGGHHLLDVVDDHGQGARCEEGAQPGLERRATARHEPERRGEDGRDELRIVDGLERHEPGAVVEAARLATQELDREARLACAPRADERDQPVRVQQPGEGVELHVATDEGRQSRGQVAATGSTCSLQRRKGRVEPIGDDLVQRLGTREDPEARARRARASARRLRCGPPRARVSRRRRRSARRGPPQRSARRDACRDRRSRRRRAWRARSGCPSGRGLPRRRAMWPREARAARPRLPRPRRAPR